MIQVDNALCYQSCFDIRFSSRSRSSKSRSRSSSRSRNWRRSSRICVITDYVIKDLRDNGLCCDNEL